MEAIWVLVFGVLGVGIRYISDDWWLRSGSWVGWSTLVVNSFGCLILGWIWSYAQRHGANEWLGVPLRAWLVGFCGGLTTFSALIGQIFDRLTLGQYLVALSIGLLHVLLGLGSLTLGILIQKHLCP